MELEPTQNDQEKDPYEELNALITQHIDTKRDIDSLNEVLNQIKAKEKLIMEQLGIERHLAPNGWRLRVSTHMRKSLNKSMLVEKFGTEGIADCHKVTPVTSVNLDSPEKLKKKKT